uniref:Uncharacterized protein n=1 Tax=Ursus maritimus TaxID=29073 RepID=A0A452UD26_URSMA
LVNPTVFFDISVDREPWGRVSFELFSTPPPLPAQNTPESLCSGCSSAGFMVPYPQF